MVGKYIFILKLLFLFTVVLLSGCASAVIVNDGSVKNNIFHSSKLPEISVRVSGDYQYIGAVDAQKIPPGKKILPHLNAISYAFYNKKNEARLHVNVETFSGPVVQVPMPDYSDAPNVFQSGQITLAKTTFNTAILPTQNEVSVLLIKSYGTIFNDTIRFQIMYAEKVESEWVESEKQLSKEDIEFIRDFSKRADGSFLVEEHDNSVATPTAKSIANKS